MDIVNYFKNAERRILGSGYVPLDPPEWAVARTYNNKRKPRRTCNECFSNYGFYQTECPVCGHLASTF